MASGNFLHWQTDFAGKTNSNLSDRPTGWFFLEFLSYFLSACIECSFCRLIRCPGELLRICCRETVWQSPANWRSFVRWSLDQCSLAPPSVTEASCCCAVFCVFMARVRSNLEQRVFIYGCYVKTNSYKSCRRTFRRKIPDTCPSGDTLSKLVNKFRTHGILTDRKPLQRNRV
jgi:hypothetical protein